MTVPFLDLKAAYDELAERAEPAMLKALRSGWYILGPEVDDFEAAFARYCEADHAIGVANGLDALELALLALGIGSGDKVLVPSNTYIATWLAVSQCGAIPVPVEPNPETHNIDAAAVRSAPLEGVKAVIAVHLYGCPADVTSLAVAAKDAGIYLIEDGAQAHGAKWQGQRIGGHSDAVCWSFYPGKNLGALGDGGAVTTSNVDVAERLRLLRNYGSSKRYSHEIRGRNSRLDPVQAAFLSVKLDRLDEWNARRCEIAQRYLAAFENTGLGLPKVPEGADPVWHLFVIRHPERDALAAKLAERGVQTLVHYPTPPHLQGAYRDLGYTEGDFPIAEQLARNILSLPMGPHLSREQSEQVIEAVLTAI